MSMVDPNKGKVRPHKTMLGLEALLRLLRRLGIELAPEKKIYSHWIDYVIKHWPVGK